MKWIKYIYILILFWIHELGKKEKDNGDQLLKPLTGLIPLITTKVDKYCVGACNACMGMENTERYMWVWKRNCLYSSLPESYIYSSYHKGHISNIYLSSANTILCVKTAWYIKHYLSLPTRYSLVAENNSLVKFIKFNCLILNLSLLHLNGICFVVTSLKSKHLTFRFFSKIFNLPVDS